MSEKFLLLAEVSRLLRVDIKTLRRLAKAGEFPQRTARGWVRSEVLAWMASIPVGRAVKVREKAESREAG